MSTVAGANVVGNFVASNNVPTNMSQALGKTLSNVAKDETVSLHDRLPAHRQRSPHERLLYIFVGPQGRTLGTVPRIHNRSQDGQPSLNDIERKHRK